ncbi:helix-turn-helix domain-containing protein [Actinoplanes sp. NPDC000266]
MEPLPHPMVQRRRLRAELRRARAESRRTQKEVVADLGWSLSKLVRIENGQTGISRSDLRALLDFYGVTDPDGVRLLLELAADSRRQSAWSAYRDVLDPDFMAYLAYEESASLVRQSETLLVPGLLQTEEYAYAVTRQFASADMSGRDIERLVEARMVRQELLGRDSCPEMFFVLDEAVVRRWVGEAPGSGKVMVRQLRYLQELAERPGISIQILPFRSGLHYGIGGPFTILEFPGLEDDELLFVENRKGPTWRDNTDTIASYKERFWHLEELAIDAADLPGYLESAIKEME